MRVRRSAGAAWAGLAALFSHLLGYQIAFSDPHQRAHVLEGSGHGWLGFALPMLLVMGVVALAGTWVNARRTTRTSRLGLFSMFPISAAAFLAVEVLERLHHHGDPRAAFTNLAASWLPIGLGLLLLLLLSPLFMVVRRAVESLASRRTAPSSSAALPAFRYRFAPHVDPLHHLHADRGPPAGTGVLFMHV